MEAQSSGSVKADITAYEGTIIAPIFNNVCVTGDINFSQNTGSSSGASLTTVPDSASVITEYKSLITDLYAYTEGYTSHPGEHMLIEDCYVDPLIIQIQKENSEEEQDINFKEKNIFKLKTNQHFSISNLLSPNISPIEKPLKAVILQGNSGNGKSFTAQKIILDWAKGEIYAGIFDVVFHLRCSELNEISENVSLVELLNCSDEMTPIIKNKRNRLLFLVDGFDELSLSLPKLLLPVNVDIKAKPGAILSSLLKGVMLNEACLLITTRSVATKKLEKSLKKPHRFTEILGFSEKGVEEYFQRFFVNVELSKQVHEQVKSHEQLYAACFSPVMCWLICTVYKQKGNTGMMAPGLESTTSIFLDFVLTLLEHRCQGLNRSQQLILLKNLGQIAERGILEKKVIFEELGKQRMSEDFTNIPFLCTLYHIERTNVKERYRFIHLSFQEFFAALFYILLDKKEVIAKVQKLLESTSLQLNRHLLPVVQFLFGLCNKKVSALLEEKYQTEVSQELCALLQKWIHKLEWWNLDFKFYCLYELNDAVFAKNVMKIQETEERQAQIYLRSSEMMAFVAALYSLQFCKRITHLRVECTADNLKMLQTTLAKSESLELQLSNMSNVHIDSLITAMGKGKHLSLRLRDGTLSDHNLRRIINTLYMQKSVNGVCFGVEAITHETAKIFINGFSNLKNSRFSIVASDKDKSLCSNFELSSFNRLEELKLEFFPKSHYTENVMECGPKALKISLKFPSMRNFNLEVLFNTATMWNKRPNITVEMKLNSLFSVLKSVPLTKVEMQFSDFSDFFNFARPLVLFLQACPTVSSFSPCTAKDIESKPKIRKLSLIFPSTRRVNFETFFNTITEWNERSNFVIEEKLNSLVALLKSVPSIIVVKIKLSNFPEFFKVAGTLVIVFQTCSSILFFRLIVDNLAFVLARDGFGYICHSCMIEKNYSLNPCGLHEKCCSCVTCETVLCLGCDHLKHHPEMCETVETFVHGSHSVLPCITLFMGQRAKFNNGSWEQFFQIFHKLKSLPVSSKDEHDLNLTALLTSMKTFSGLKVVHLALSFVTVQCASSILHFFQTCPFLKQINVKCSAVLENNRCICASCTSKQCLGCDHSKQHWSMYEVDGDVDLNHVSNTSAQNSGWGMWGRLSPPTFPGPPERLQPALIRTHRDSQENLYIDLGVTRNTKDEFKFSLRCDGYTTPVIAFIFLIVTDFSDVTRISWESFFQSYYDTQELTERHVNFEEKIGALLSFVYSVQSLEKVEFGINGLTESWASKILHLFYANPRIHVISVLEEDKSDGDSTCSSFIISRNFTHDTVSVKVVSLEESSTPSVIFFTIQYSAIQRLNGAGLLRKMKLLNELTESSQTYNERVTDLISHLCSVSGLLKLKLEIKTLTLNWSTWIIFFKTCRQLKKIIVITQNPLMDEALINLKKSWTYRRCSLVVKGVVNLDYGNTEGVKITFPGAQLEKSMYCSDSDDEGNVYNDDYNRFIC